MWRKKKRASSRKHTCATTSFPVSSPPELKIPIPLPSFSLHISPPLKRKNLSLLFHSLYFSSKLSSLHFFNLPCSFFSCNLLMLPTSAQIIIFCYLFSIIPFLSYSFAPLLQPPPWPQGGHIFATRLMHAASWKLSFTSNKISSIPLRGNIKYPLVLLIKAIIINTRVGLQKEGVYKYVPLWWSSQV